MKRILFVLSALLIGAVTVSAQDVITKKNGEDVKAKVLEVDNNNVKYKLFSEPDGVTYTVPKSQVLMIRYESGRNEVFNAYAGPYRYDREPVADIRPGMKYKELKKLYNYQDYMSGYGDATNPALMGLASWLVPGLGQMISGEVGRGCAWLGGAFGCSLLMAAGSLWLTESMMDTSPEDAAADRAAGITFMLLGSVGLLTVDICAIVDACRVSKVRNMYNQDLRKNYSLELHPSVDYIRMANRVQPTAGVTLAMRF